jgi:hypothetical protein
MKKLFIIVAILFSCATTILAQGAWELLVTWDDSDQNCACGTYTTAQFKIVMEIYDDANEASVGTQTVYVNYTANEYTFDCSSSPIDVDYYCNVINPEHTPSFTIKCRVTFGHYGSGIPEEHCTKAEWMPMQTCYDFSLGITFDPELLLE